ncbi:MAG: hypothetical protein ACRCW2_03315 [Cellulosilyticaceae bacterium]
MKKCIGYLIILLCVFLGGIGVSAKEPTQEASSCKVEILGLKAEKKVYGIGETMRWVYCYEGPLGKGEYLERWYCRKEGQEWQVLFGKPEAFFESGDYEVGLQLRDEDGDWSALYSGQVTVGKQIVSEELAYSAKKQPIGSCVENLSRTNYRGYPQIPYELKQNQEGTLVLSNSPENVKAEGVLYRSFFKGDGTLFVHHIQGFKDNQRRGFEVTVLNLSDTTVSLELERKAFKGPHQNVVWMGQSVLLDYLGKKDESKHLIPAGDRYVLYKQDKWRQQEVISALMGIKTDGPVMIEVRVYKPGDLSSGREPLAKDVHPRGTFYGGSREYHVVFKDHYDICTLVVGEKEEWICGKDAMTGEVVSNKGNYGVPHIIDVMAEEDVDIFLNPRGDMFKGAICWDYQTVYPIPEGGCLRNQQKLIYLGHIKKGERHQLIYMLPSASAAPVVIVFAASNMTH